MSVYSEAQVQAAMVARNIDSWMRPVVLDYIKGKTSDGRSHTTWTVASKHDQDEKAVQEAVHATLEELEARTLDPARHA